MRPKPLYEPLTEPLIHPSASAELTARKEIIMTRGGKGKVRVYRKLWRDFSTGETTDVLTITVGTYFVKVPFDQARRVCDELHDACDERDRELREQP